MLYPALALFSLGISGVWIGGLSALAPYQPLFIAISLLSLGYGFRRVYWTQAACAAGGACAAARPRRLIKGALWLATVMVGIALVWPYAVPVLLS